MPQVRQGPSKAKLKVRRIVVSTLGNRYLRGRIHIAHSPKSTSTLFDS